MARKSEGFIAVGVVEGVVVSCCCEAMAKYNQTHRERITLTIGLLTVLHPFNYASTTPPSSYLQTCSPCYCAGGTARKGAGGGRG
jgi:hypothetical protein